MSIRIPFQTPDGPQVSGGKQLNTPVAQPPQAVSNSQTENKQTETSMGVPQKNKGNSQGGCGGDNPFMSFGLLAVMMVVFYFFLIRPQQKKQKEHQGLLNALMKGDKVVTSGGILGTIVSINDRIVTLEVGDKTKIKVLRHYIQGKQMDNKGADSNTDSGRKKE